MTIKEIAELPLGTALFFRQGKLTSPCFLATKKRDSRGRVMVSNRRLLNRAAEQRWWARPVQLTLARVKES